MQLPAVVEVEAGGRGSPIKTLPDGDHEPAHGVAEPCVCVGQGLGDANDESGSFGPFPGVFEGRAMPRIDGSMATGKGNRSRAVEGFGGGGEGGRHEAALMA